MRHFPSQKAPSRLEGMSHMSHDRAPIYTQYPWLMFWTGFVIGVCAAVWSVFFFCQGGAG